MSPLVTEQLWQHVGVRPLRTFAVRGGNRLKDLDASDPTHKHPMRACRENDGHCRVPRLEQGPSDMRPELCCHVRIGHADAKIRLESAEAEIEQRGLPIPFLQCLAVVSQLGERSPPVHGASGRSQAQRNTMVPAVSRRGLRCKQSHILLPFDANAAASSHHGDGGVAPRHHDRLIRLASKLRNRPESPQAPVRFMVAYLASEKVDVLRDVAHRRTSVERAADYGHRAQR
jgi:hypothetical protein